MGHIPNLCKSTNTQRFTCNGTKVVYNSSLIWGTIGPQRMFQSGQVYSGIMYFFIIGVRLDLLNLSRLSVAKSDFVAYGNCPRLPAISKISQQLGTIYQRPNLLQRCRQYPSCQHKYVSCLF